MAVLPNSALPGTTLGIGNAIRSGLLGAVNQANGVGRQNVADMYKYGSNDVSRVATLFSFAETDASQDWRVRVSLAPGATYFYNDASNNLLSPLRTEPNSINKDLNTVFNAGISALGLTPTATSGRIGVVFPYTPTVAITHTANYTQQKLTHNNYASYFYENSEVSPITITAEFTVQSIDEGRYLMATIYFFRSLTKMFFGRDQQAGNPPPMVYLNGYGKYYLPNVPCVVTSFAHTMPGDCDYMDIPEPNADTNPRLTNPRMNSTRLPTTSTVTLTLQPIYSRTSQSTTFSLNDFARGALINTQGAAGQASSFGGTPLNGRNITGGFL